MSEFPSLPLFTDAFLADTGHLTAHETGAYLLLLMMAWRQPGCRLPDNDQKLARWARMDGRTWARAKPAVMEFWVLDGCFWVQKRLSKERDIVSKRAEVARENGSRGGRPKSLENNDQANPAGSSRVTQAKAPNPNPKEEKKEDKPLSLAEARKQAVNAEFFGIWERWGEKVDRKSALKAYHAARKKVSAEVIAAGVANYIDAKPPDRQWSQLASWLNRERWTDVYAPRPQTNVTPFRGSYDATRSTTAEARRRLERVLLDEAADARWGGDVLQIGSPEGGDDPDGMLSQGRSGGPGNLYLRS